MERPRLDSHRAYAAANPHGDLEAPALSVA
jgi:hypothetical protein